MASTVIERAQSAIREIADVSRELAALERMSVDQLAEKYRELYGEPTRTRNKPYLRKRLMWRIQELAEGGLSLRVRAKIEELGQEFPERWRMRQAAASAEQPPAPRDPRLPAPGSVIEKVFGDSVHRVTVLERSFEYRGERFRSLSAIARRITGTSWNGFAFFALKAPADAGERRGGVR